MSVIIQKQNNTHHKSELKSNAGVPKQDPNTDLLVFLVFYSNFVIFIDGQIIYIYIV